MDGILQRVFNHALDLVDALDDLVAEAALGFGAAAPMLIDPDGDAPSNLSRAGD